MKVEVGSVLHRILLPQLMNRMERSKVSRKERFDL